MTSYVDPKHIFNSKNISKVLRVIRKNNNITQLELANKLIWKRSRLAKIEIDCQRMYLEDFLMLCDGLKVCPLDVLKASLNKNEVPEFEKLLTKDEKAKEAKIKKLEAELNKLRNLKQ